MSGDPFAYEVPAFPGARSGKVAVTSNVGRLRTSVLRRWKDVHPMAEAWSDLVERSRASCVFQTFEWHRAWERTYASAGTPFVVLAHEGSKLVGIAPLMILEGGARPVGGRRFGFIGSSNDASDYCDFILDPDYPWAIDCLLEAVWAESKRPDQLVFSHFPSHSPNRVRLLAFFGQRTSRVVEELEAPAPVRLLGDRASDRKATSKSSLRRHFNHFDKSGTLSLRLCETEAEIVGHLDAFFDQHVERWEGTGHASQFLDTTERDFFREAARQLLPRGWMKFHVLSFDGRPIAYHFGFEYRRRFIWYKPAFDVRLKAKSPGEVMIKLLMEDAIRRNLLEFDFTVGAEPFKRRFTNLVRSNVRITVHRGLLDYFGYHLKRAARGIRNRVFPSGMAISARP